MISRQERAEQALRHYSLMKKEYEKDIEKSIANSVVYSEKSRFDERKSISEHKKTKLILEDSDTVRSIFKHYKKDDMCVLNFALYKNPGGGFISGVKAQEELSSLKKTNLRNWMY